MTAALAAEPAKFPATSFPVVPAPLGAYKPFTSQFQLYTALGQPPEAALVEKASPPPLKAATAMPAAAK